MILEFVLMLLCSTETMGNSFSWSSEPCSVGAQIDRDGKVAIVHSVDSPDVDIMGRVAVDKGTYFGVFWDQDSYPTASSGCGGGVCQVRNSTCVCNNVVVETVTVFSQVPSLDDVTSQLHIGASFDTGTYSLCTAPVCASLEYDIYSVTPVSNDISIGDAFDERTIFEVASRDGPVHLSNTKSTVHIIDENNGECACALCSIDFPSLRHLMKSYTSWKQNHFTALEIRRSSILLWMKLKGMAYMKSTRFLKDMSIIRTRPLSFLQGLYSVSSIDCNGVSVSSWSCFILLCNSFSLLSFRRFDHVKSLSSLCKDCGDCFFVRNIYIGGPFIWIRAIRRFGGNNCCHFAG